MTKKQAPCALCKKVQKLCQSHIIPEFFYKPLYDKDGQYVVMSTDPEDTSFARQKGIWEYLLCPECEGLLNKWETYVRNVIYSKTIELTYEKHSLGFTVHGLEYDKCKLFQMSVLWRAGVAERPEYGAVELGPHAESLRTMIFNGDPGEPHEYGCRTLFPPQHKETLNKVK